MRQAVFFFDHEIICACATTSGEFFFLESAGRLARVDRLMLFLLSHNNFVTQFDGSCVRCNDHVNVPVEFD